MTGILSKEAAARVWMAHKEIETGEKLLAEIKEALKSGGDPTPVDDFGHRTSYTLGVPRHNGLRLLNVSPRMTAYVIEAHIAAKRQELIEVSLAAKMELDGVAP